MDKFRIAGELRFYGDEKPQDIINIINKKIHEIKLKNKPSEKFEDRIEIDKNIKGKWYISDNAEQIDIDEVFNTKEEAEKFARETFIRIKNPSQIKLPSSKGIKKFKDFTGRDKAKIVNDKILLPGDDTDNIFIGKCPEVVYLSDKWAGKKTRAFKHSLKKHGNWLAVVNRKTGRVETLLVTGINLKIDKRGLLG